MNKRPSLPVTNAKTAAAKEAAAITEIRVAGESVLAKQMASKIIAATFDEFESIINADEYIKIVGLNMADHIRNSFTLEEIAAMPVVNTNKREDENYKGNNPDYTVVRDGKKTKRVSFFDTMLAATAYVVALVKEINDMSDVVNGKEGAKKELKLAYPNPAEQKAHLNKLRKRLTTVQAKWRTGMRVVQQEAKLEELMGDYITFNLTKDSKGNVIAGPEPIYLMAILPKGTAPRFDNFSVTSFLSLNIETALATREADTALATWNALLATLSKEEPEDESDPDNIVINGGSAEKTKKRFETACASMLTLLHDSPEFLLGVVKEINGAKDFDEVRSMVKTYGDLANEFGAFKQHIQKRYERAVVQDSISDGTADPKTLREAALAN